LYKKGSSQDIRYQTTATEYSTDEEMLGNRKRVRQAAAIGKGAGAIAGIATELVRGDIDISNLNPLNRGNGDSNTAGANTGEKPPTSTTGNTVANSQAPNPSTSEATSAPKTEASVKNPDTGIKILKNKIDAGHGQTQELNDMFTQNGISPANPQEAKNIFEQLTSKYGGNLTNNNTYDLGNGTQGFTTAGNQVLWKPGVPEDAARILAELRSGN